MSDRQISENDVPVPPASRSTDLTLETAKKHLMRFMCTDVVPVLSAEEKQATREAVLFLAETSDYQTIGICADTVEQGRQAMEAYLAVLVRPVALELPPTEGPIYLKFNTQKGAWYLDAYPGNSRGVLVSCHSAYEEDANGTYGHLPLDLFSDE